MILVRFLFDDCFVLVLYLKTMLKHLANQVALCHVIPSVLCVVVYRNSLVCVSKSFFYVFESSQIFLNWVIWIESNFDNIKFSFSTSESIQIMLNRIMKTLWLWLNRFIRIWIVSIFTREHINRFKRCMMCINLHSSSWLLFNCLNRFTHLANRFTMLFLAKNFHLPPFSIYKHFLITPKPLNHLHLFSLGLKNSLFKHSSRLSTFSYNHFVLWVIWFARVLIEIVSWFFQGN